MAFGVEPENVRLKAPQLRVHGDGRDLVSEELLHAVQHAGFGGSVQNRTEGALDPTVVAYGCRGDPFEINSFLYKAFPERHSQYLKIGCLLCN
jgi:hypothetical protein